MILVSYKIESFNLLALHSFIRFKASWIGCFVNSYFVA
jgi:hypothetical protein